MKQAKIYLASEYAKIRKEKTWLKSTNFLGIEYKTGYIIGGEGILPIHCTKKWIADAHLKTLARLK